MPIENKKWPLTKEELDKYMAFLWQKFFGYPYWLAELNVNAQIGDTE